MRLRYISIGRICVLGSVYFCDFPVTVYNITFIQQAKDFFIHLVLALEPGLQEIK
jgi:hypothetical protein